MPGAYAVLAPIYEILGSADFSRDITPHLINYAQRNEWMGRHILDLGCGTGASAVWLCQRGFLVTGVDSSPEMLQTITDKLDDHTHPLFKPYQQDIRSLQTLDIVDMVLALDVLNEMDSLREIEKVFNSVKDSLATQKLFIFDMYTIQGLTFQGQESGQIISNREDGLMVVITNTYDYERQVNTRSYTIFQQQGELWRHQEAVQMLRAYPIQAVTALLQRSGFSIMNVFNTDFEAYEPGVSSAPRVIFIAQKQ